MLLLLPYVQSSSMSLFFRHCPPGLCNLTEFEGEKTCTFIRTESGSEDMFCFLLLDEAEHSNSLKVLTNSLHEQLCLIQNHL